MTASRPPFALSEIDLFIFDLDGTLVDSSVDIADCVNHALRGVGLPPWSVEDVKRMIGHGTKALVKKALENREEFFDRAFASFTDHYLRHLLDHTHPYPGVEEVLAALAPKPRAVMSNKRQMYCDPIVDGLGLRRHLDAVLGGDILAHRKPHPEPILNLCERFAVPPARTAMVGDSPIDVGAARAAGTRSIVLTGGFSAAGEVLDCGADWVLETVASMLPHIKPEIPKTSGRK